jgi:phosphinothricin acetyltransferase
MTVRVESVQEKGMPYIVVEVFEQIAGYAYESSYRPKAGYRFTLKDSKCLNPKFSKNGIGINLLMQLLRRCKASGYREIVAVIRNFTNHTLISLHEQAGFVEVDVFHNIGFKFRRFFDSI